MMILIPFKLCRRVRDRMLVGYTAQSVYITTEVVRWNLAHGEAYSLQNYMMKLVCVLRQVGGFFLVLRFPPPIKLTATI
jgi:hypothetical protein